MQKISQICTWKTKKSKTLSLSGKKLPNKTLSPTTHKKKLKHGYVKDYGLISSMKKKWLQYFYNEIRKPKYMFNHLNSGRLQVVICQMTLVDERVNMNKQTYLSEQERNLRAYYMPRHGIFSSFSTWILLSDMEKYFAMSWNFYDVTKYSLTSLGIFCHFTSMVCSEMNNGLLTLNMGLAKKAVNNNIVSIFKHFY